MFRILLLLFYKSKIKIMRRLLGPQAIEAVLYDSFFPRLVLEIGGATIGRNVRINRWLSIHECGGSFKGLKIGDDVHIGKFVFLDLTQPMTIGNRVGVGMFSKVLSHQNLGDTRLKQLYPAESGPVSIPDDVALSAGTTLLYPTRLAPGTLVAAGAVVRGDYDKPCVLMGNPARVIREIPPEGLSGQSA
jgi:acetyltransferase-like isoleucine patch superfamily enzyme